MLSDYRTFAIGFVAGCVLVGGLQAVWLAPSITRVKTTKEPEPVVVEHRYRPPPLPAANGSSPAGQTPPKVAFAKVHLVVSHYSESLDWLHGGGWGAAHTATVYHKDHRAATPDFSFGFAQYAGAAEGGRVSHAWLTNFGDEAAAYLRFIIDHYDDLPDITVFLHGKPEAHNKRIGETVACLREETWFTFVTTSFIDNRCILYGNNASLLPNADKGAFADFWLEFPWDALGLASVPRCVSFYCCAQFAVSRGAVQARPKAFYQKLWSVTLGRVLDQNVARRYSGWSLRQAGGVFEHLWHVVFQERPMMHRIDPCRHFKLGCFPCKPAPPAEASAPALPPNHPSQAASQRGIRVSEAFYAVNCYEPGQVPIVSARLHSTKPSAKDISDVVGSVKNACDGRASCQYTIAVKQSVAYECGSRDYTVAWTCGQDPRGAPPRTMHVPAEANGKSILLTCE
ncbi:hypothetical protein DIPPA_29503 [Diplonema papillatum]|nr:hypothetical protein DIPPA_29503 [Diplonema papillatum]